MKKITYLMAALAIAGCQKEAPKEYMVFSGKVAHVNAETGSVRGHELNEEFAIAPDGTFSDTLKISEPGYYSFKIGTETSTFYLKNGADIHLNIDTEQFDESITYKGPGAPENNYLAKKYLANEKVTENYKAFFSLGEDAFIAKIDSLNGAHKKSLAASKSSEDFVKLEEKNLLYDKYNNMYTYIQYHPYVTQDNTYVPSDKFKKELEKIDLDNEADANAYSSYSNIVVNDFYQKVTGIPQDSFPKEAVAVIKTKKSPKVQEILMSNLAYEIQPGNEEVSSYYFHQFTELSTNEEFKSEILKKYELVKKLAKGAPSPEFSYENYEGGKLTLVDLKGKFVYIDVWATWCGPCKREIPFLKQVEEKYHGKNISFVSISIDEIKDHDTWKNFVKDQQLGGIQLYADNAWKSDFVQNYGIEGIPRFILLDPEGRIVDASAPRPSDSGLIDLFNELKI